MDASALTADLSAEQQAALAQQLLDQARTRAVAEVAQAVRELAPDAERALIEAGEHDGEGRLSFIRPLGLDEMMDAIELLSEQLSPRILGLAMEAATIGAHPDSYEGVELLLDGKPCVKLGRVYAD